MRTKYFKFVVLVVIGIFAARNGGAKAKEEIIVSAAASLTNAMTKITREFEKVNSGIKVVLNFASSGSLLQQIIHGAPIDVFASANKKFMDEAQKRDLVLSETRKNFAKNKLVLAAPRNPKIAIKTIHDLLLPEIQKISIGNPSHTPVGRYARESLKAYGLWKKLADKLVFANSAPQICHYLNREEVEAGIVYFTDVQLGGEKIRIIMELDKHQSIVYSIAVLTSSAKKESANRFVHFTLSKRGQEILALHGFYKSWK